MKKVINSSMRGNVTRAGISMAVNSVGDTYEFLSGKQTGEEYVKNMGRNAAGVGGGIVGTEVGAAIGSCICPGIGTAVGGFVGRYLGSFGARSLF